MYGTKGPNFIGLWSISLELLKFIGSYPPNLEIKIKLKINIGCVPPLAAVAALILLWIELTKALTVRIGMLFHSSINAFLSCARVAGWFRRFLTLLSSSSHMCSIGVKSGLYGGHASGAMLLFARKSWQTRATCGRALSCCRIRLRCCTSGTATGRKISSLYLTAVILPATIINCDFIPWAMPPQTITEPPQTDPVRQHRRRQSVLRDVGTHDVDHLRDREWT